MVKFDCPHCDEKMEIEEEMIGRKVRCVGCGEMIRVPDWQDDDEPRQRRRRRDRGFDRRSQENDEGLSGAEWAMFTVLFLFIPCVNAIVSSVLYYVWRAEQPTRAGQINMLGFLVFGFDILIAILIAVVRG